MRRRALGAALKALLLPLAAVAVVGNLIFLYRAFSAPACALQGEATGESARVSVCVCVHVCVRARTASYAREI